MIAKHNIPRKGFGRKLAAGLCALVTSATGCFSGGSVEAYVGSHVPTKQQTGTYLVFDNSTETGARGRVNTKAGVGFEVGFSGHKTTYEDELQRNEIKAQDTKAGVRVQVLNKGQVSVHVNGGAVSRTESETLYDELGNELYAEDRSTGGWYAGVDVEWTPVKHLSVGARAEWQGFGKNSYEEAGSTVSASVGYSF